MITYKINNYENDIMLESEVLRDLYDLWYIRSFDDAFSTTQVM
jgi:hypothetical protein